MPLTVGASGKGGKSIFWSWQRPRDERSLAPDSRGPAMAGGTIMTIGSTAPTAHPVRTDWAGAGRALEPCFAARAVAHDTDDSFVADNFAELRARRLFSAAVPAEL